MSVLFDTVKSGDWKGEKHVPVIDAPKSVKKGELCKIGVCVGKEIAHPNTLEHHISWIKLYFVEEGKPLAVEIASSQFSANGEGDIFTEPFFNGEFKFNKSGTLVAVSYCNIHGLWENSVEITVE